MSNADDSSEGEPSLAEHPNAALLRRWLEDGWAAGNVALADELFHEDFLGHDPSHPTIEGREPLKLAARESRGAFVDVVFDYGPFMLEEDRIGVAFTVRGRHVKPFLGIPASDKRIEFSGTVIFRVVDGRFKEGWQTVDISKLLRDAGLPATVPGPPPADVKEPAWAKRWGLEPRYVRVARLIMDGLSDGEIALTTGLTRDTVRTYARDILKAANVRSRVDLARACGAAVVA